MPIQPGISPYSRPPAPRDPVESARWTESAQRRRLLYSGHYSDVWDRVVRSIGAERARAWLPLDMSSNPYCQVWDRLSMLYRQERDIEGPDPEVVDAVEEAGVGSLLQRVQRDTLGLGETMLLCDLDEDGQPLAHLIYPDLATVKVNPRRPRELLEVHWWEPDPRDDTAWVQWRIGGGTYRAFDAKGADITTALRGVDADLYPWVGQDGAPLMPVVMYHRSITGSTWDPYTHREIVEGSLQLGLLYTHYTHIIRQAAWRQRYGIDVEWDGGEPEDTGTGSNVIVADPATVLSGRSAQGANGQPLVGSFEAPADPAKVIESIRIYERRLIEQAMGGVEVTRETSDIRSGYSLAVGREERMSLANVYAPVFRLADRECYRVWSDLLAVYRGVSYATRWPMRRGAGTRKDPADIEYVIAPMTESTPDTPTKESTPNV